MKEVIYVSMKNLTIADAMKMHEDGYEVLVLENGYALLTRGGVA